MRQVERHVVVRLVDRVPVRQVCLDRTIACPPGKHVLDGKPDASVMFAKGHPVSERPRVFLLPAKRRMEHHGVRTQGRSQLDGVVHLGPRLWTPDPLREKQCRRVDRHDRHGVQVRQRLQRACLQGDRVGPHHDLDTVIAESLRNVESSGAVLRIDRRGGQRHSRAGHPNYGHGDEPNRGQDAVPQPAEIQSRRRRITPSRSAQGQMSSCAMPSRSMAASATIAPASICGARSAETPDSLARSATVIPASRDTKAVTSERARVRKAYGPSELRAALARIAGAARSSDGPYALRTLARSDVTALVSRLAGMTVAERSKLSGVSAERAPQMLAGAIVADAAMDLLGIEQLDICPWALREGVILRRLDWISAG